MWETLLSNGEERTLPWIGGTSVSNGIRTWRISGRLPREHGWYKFSIDGSRKAELVKDEPQDIEHEHGETCATGYIVGERFVPDTVRVDPDPANFVKTTQPLYLVERGLERFVRAEVWKDQEGRLIYKGSLWPEGAEFEVEQAYQDRKTTLKGIPGVTPALDLSFRYLSYMREQAEERRRQREAREAAERARLEEEARKARIRQEIAQGFGTGARRRIVAKEDYELAAKAALAMSGAELLDVRESWTKGEWVVQFRFRNRRFECVAGADLNIIDAGVCLDDHAGTKGDTFFTLESLPGVLAQAIDEGVLVVWRHVDERDW